MRAVRLSVDFCPNHMDDSLPTSRDRLKGDTPFIGATGASGVLGPRRELPDRRGLEAGARFETDPSTSPGSSTTRNPTREDEPARASLAAIFRKSTVTLVCLVVVAALSLIAPPARAETTLLSDSTGAIAQPALLDSGSVAPDFELTDQHGARVRASTLWRDAPLIVYFYPADFTPGCTKEAHAFELERPAIEATGAHLVAISVDDVTSHGRFAEHCGTGYSMLADSGGLVARSYGADLTLGTGERTRTLARRISYLLGPGGVVWRGWIVSDPMLHAAEVRKALVERIAARKP